MGSLRSSRSYGSFGVEASGLSDGAPVLFPITGRVHADSGQNPGLGVKPLRSALRPAARR